MNLAHLTYFSTLADCKSYRDAADACAVSQSTLSTAISGLEKELGCSLFARKKGSVELTEQGQTFKQYVDASLRFLQQGIELVKEHSGDAIKELTIGTIFSAQSQDWSRLIYEYRRRMHGDVQIKVVQSTTADLLRKLKSGFVDVAFVGAPSSDAALAQCPCWTQEAVLLVNREHPFAKREELSLDELRGHYLISYALDGPLGAEFVKLVHGHDLTVDCLYDDEITLASIVAANPDVMAIACRSWLLNAYLDDMKLVRIKEAPADFHQLYFCHRAEDDRPRVVEEFIAMAKELWS